MIRGIDETVQVLTDILMLLEKKDASVIRLNAVLRIFRQFHMFTFVCLSASFPLVLFLPTRLYFRGRVCWEFVADKNRWSSFLSLSITDHLQFVPPCANIDKCTSTPCTI